MKRFLLSCCFFLATNPAYGQDKKLQAQVDALVRRSPDEVARLITVKGDDMDPSITISSYGATQIVSKGLLASTTIENSFLRAFIKKSDGAVTAQIYHVAQYGGQGWNFFNRATYQAPGGIRETATDKIGSDVNCYKYGCSYTEEIGIPIDFDVLEAAAKAYDPANPASGIHYRLFGKSGQNIDDAIPGNEIVAFVKVVSSRRPTSMQK